MSITAYIALGSNLGDRRDFLERALHALREHPGVFVGRVSSFRETKPVGGPRGQGAYLNAAAELQTDLAPLELLRLLLEVERRLGRVRGERWGPRTIDLDLLLYGDLVCTTPELTLPHPRLHERRFVLEPLDEVAPLMVHPLLGRTVRQLLNQLLVEDAAPVPPTPGRELAGLRAVVTGSTSGIGRAIALELARGGADVLIHGRRSPQAAEAVAEQVRLAGLQAHVLLADLRDPAECQRLVDTAWNTDQGLDIWINNAGADTLTGEAVQWSFQRKLEELLAVDVMATVLLSRAVGQRMQAAGGGVIVNMGWDQAETGMEGDSGQLFGTTKAAVIAFRFGGESGTDGARQLPGSRVDSDRLGRVGIVRLAEARAA
jgi:2-amino-4-hydroxy-6-hydroxymethyldihydropteridine diphosphokinase